MGLRDLFRRGDSSAERNAAERVDAGRPQGDEPGAMSTPTADGQGTVTLGDRVGAGSPGSNQPATEQARPPAGTEHPAAPPLGAMNAGAAASQTARPPALPPVSSAAQGPPAATALQERLTPSPAEGGFSEPSDVAGTAQRAPGLMGGTPAGEQVETDVDAGAANMADVDLGNSTGGDSHSVSTPGEDAALGTSEQARPVQGVRRPIEDDAPL